MKTHATSLRTEGRRSERRARQAPARAPIVGLLVDCLEDDYHWSVVRGAVDAACSRGASLLCFAGGSLGAPVGEGGERNGVFDLARPASIDALVVMSGAIGNRIGAASLRAYCERFHPLPMCSIGVALDCMASVCIDNEAGMRSALDHLIREHGMTRIAFIRGPEANAEAERRYGVYVQMLGAAGIPFRPDLVARGDFEPSGGLAAVRALLGDRGLTARDVDAIVAANDAMALGALEGLSQLGVRVPDDVAVVGFDDVEDARLAVPALTTVHQPLYEQGGDAVAAVLDQLENRAPGATVVRGTRLVVRRSCGCTTSEAPLPTELSRQAMRRLRTETRARALGRAAAAIASAHDLDDLWRAVASSMPALGITRCHLATFDSSSGDGRSARLALSYAPGADPGDALSWQLRPAVDILRHMVVPEGGHALAVLPTVFRDEEFGLLVLGLEGEAYLYETLRSVFTAALAGARRSAPPGQP